MLSLLSSLSLALSAPAATQPEPPGTIVITGQRIRDYRERLANCLARNCPPDEDIRESTALAEMLLINGDYRGARSVLRKSVGRNKDEAARYPEPVSELYRADARVARHLGLDDDAQRSTRDILKSLKTGLPVEDERHLIARLELAHAFIFFQDYNQAEAALKDLSRASLRADRPDMARVAEMQMLWVDYKRGMWGPTEATLLKLAESADPQRSIGAKILLIRMYAERGEKREADAIIARLGKGGKSRALLFEPDYTFAQYETVMSTRDRMKSLATNMSPDRPETRFISNKPIAPLSDRMTDNFEDAWVDVSFRIRADGRVADVQVIRRGPGSPGWEDPLLKAVGGRRYTAANENQDTIKIERFTYTARMWQGAGSRIPSRSLRARVERIELSSVDVPA